MKYFVNVWKLTEKQFEEIQLKLFENGIFWAEEGFEEIMLKKDCEHYIEIEDNTIYVSETSNKYMERSYNEIMNPKVFYDINKLMPLEIYKDGITNGYLEDEPTFEAREMVVEITTSFLKDLVIKKLLATDIDSIDVKEAYDISNECILELKALADRLTEELKEKCYYRGDRIAD